MAHKPTLDPLADAQRRANNNFINPYRGMPGVNMRRFAHLPSPPFYFGILSVVLLPLLVALLVHLASNANYLWEAFHLYWNGKPELLALAVFFPLWLLSLFSTMSWLDVDRLFQLQHTQPKPKVRRPKKKLPKHRKDYG
jgi:hypothetical protein